MVVLTRKRSQDPDNWSIKFNQFFPPNCVVSPPPYLSPAYQGDPETWSIQNQFFPPNCVLSPRLSRFLSLNSEGQDREIFSPNLNLEILAEVHQDRSGIDISHPTETLQFEHFPSIMDAEDYKTKFLNVRKAFAKVERRVKFFGPEDVTLEDKDTYKDYLGETRRLLDDAQEIAFNLIT